PLAIHPRKPDTEYLLGSGHRVLPHSGIIWLFQVSLRAICQTRTVVTNSGHPSSDQGRRFVDSKCHTDTIKQGRETVFGGEPWPNCAPQASLSRLRFVSRLLVRRVHPKLSSCSIRLMRS